MTLTWPRLFLLMLLCLLLGIFTVLVSADDEELCDPDNPTEFCVVFYNPPDGWCHWIEKYSPLWYFLNCQQTLALEADGIVAVGDPQIESVPFGAFRFVRVRRHYSDGITREFVRLVPQGGQP